ncbi:MAG: FHA domain-containing protein [Muribaculaceae bacterium]|nr:FHA domain-containing protein [Muribaculaceae bacterium]
MAEIVRVKCPKCGSILKIGKREGMEKMNLTCPICGYKGLFSTYIPLDSQQATKKDDTDIDSDKTQNDDETEVLKKSMSIGRLRCNGQVYELKEGENIIGRKADSSEATIQIADETRRMSRRHITITVIRVGKNTVQHRLQLSKEKVNTTLLNNEKLQPGDIMILNNGDVITLPHGAKLVFEIDGSSKMAGSGYGDSTTL